ncbi:hypothetical protein D3C80_1079990 [compost metagenome]
MIVARASGARVASGASSAAPRGRMRERVKVEPCPGVLRTVKRPPISSIRSRLMLRPRPEPPKRAATPSAV